MPEITSTLPFQSLAKKHFLREINDHDLALVIPTLPVLDRSMLENLATEAETIAHSQPRLAWELCHLVYKASVFQKCGEFTRSLAAFYMARAASAWEQPGKLSSSIQIARRGFSHLNEPGWLAACEWLQSTIPLAHTHFLKEEEVLKLALIRLHQAGMEDQYYYCMLDLAWEQNLLGKYTEAEHNLNICEDFFSSRQDELALARCWRVRARIFTKSGRFEEAAQLIQNSRAIYTKFDARLDLAHLARDEGMLLLFSTTDYERTAAAFHQAISLFGECEVALSLGDAFTSLATLDLQVGNLRQAGENSDKAKKIFSRYAAYQPYADCLTVQGLVYLEEGEIDQAINNFQQVYKLHEGNRRELILSNDLFNLGNAYVKAGRYQLALQALESASEVSQKIDHPSRTGLTELYLARVWLQLKNYANAIEHITQAEGFLNLTNQADSQVAIARLRAKIFFDLGDHEKTLMYLTQALQIASKNNVPAQTALTHRLLGEVFLSKLDLAEANKNFQQAYETFKQLNMQVEQANCLLSLSRAAMTARDLPLARDYCRQALDLSHGDYTEIEWRTRTQLAEIELLESQPQKALQLFINAADMFAEIQGQFWQPTVSATYAYESDQLFENALVLAASLDRPEEALKFIEFNKANTLVNQLRLTHKKIANKSEQAIIQLRKEINWIQKQMQVNLSGNNIQTLLQMRSLRKDLQNKSHRYETLVTRLERKESDRDPIGHPQSFSLGEFRHNANLHLGKKWLALDYHQVDDAIIIAAISADSLTLHKTVVNPRFLQALNVCSQGAGEVAPSDLEALGEVLLPASIAEALTPETLLLISPHKILHRLPWAAIGKEPLVNRCIPCLVPSLHVFHLLCERIGSRQNTFAHQTANGLLLGISQFNGHHPDLPFVKQELAALQPLIGPAGKCYQDEDASQQILNRIDSTSPQSVPESDRFAWLHVASHFFSDPASGYLSGLALTDQPLWLDQIRNLAPLPALVSFSGCSSIYTRLFEGDEAIGLPSTCLLSGAQTVIGSIWPVLDESSARLMVRFYQHFLSGKTPAESLAYAQRELRQLGDEPSAWAGYICLGLP
ncbi:MAG: CHAT domain-containing protein [Anaerolineaceae bacterium]|nr:CHAT domain-containing protein [Anaerolineaceae bacterium]